MSIPQVDTNVTTPAISMTDMIDLIETLSALIAEENAQLSSGSPASLAGTLKLKLKLGTELERRVRIVRAGGLFNDTTDPVLRERLAQRSAELQTAMQANSAHLRAAMVSTRRRIDAIMRAFREYEARPGRYDSSGRRTLTRTSSLGLA